MKMGCAPPMSMPTAPPWFSGTTISSSTWIETNECGQSLHLIECGKPSRIRALAFENLVIEAEVVE